MSIAIDKLRKMIATEESLRTIGDLEQAQTWLSKIQEALFEANYSVEELFSKSPEFVFKVETRTSSNSYNQRRSKWKQSLTLGVANSLGCKSWVTPGSESILIVGLPEKLDQVQILTQKLQRVGTVLARKELKQWSLSTTLEQRIIGHYSHKTRYIAPYLLTDKAVTELFSFPDSEGELRIHITQSHQVGLLVAECLRSAALLKVVHASTARSWKRSFLVGYSESLAIRIQENIQKLTDSASTLALVHIKREELAVSEYYRAGSGKGVTPSLKQASIKSAYRLGVEAGNQITIPNPSN